MRARPSPAAGGVAATSGLRRPRGRRRGSPRRPPGTLDELRPSSPTRLIGFPERRRRRCCDGSRRAAEGRQYLFTTIAPVLELVQAPDGRQLTAADAGADRRRQRGRRARARFPGRTSSGQAARARNRRHRTSRRDFTRSTGARPIRCRPPSVRNRRPQQDRPVPGGRSNADDARVLRVHAVSCATGEGVDALKESVRASARLRRSERWARRRSPTSRLPACRLRGGRTASSADRGFRIEGTPRRTRSVRGRTARGRRAKGSTIDRRRGAG